MSLHRRHGGGTPDAGGVLPLGTAYAAPASMTSDAIQGPFGLIADVHANDAALAAVIRSLHEEGIHQIVALGDLVGYHLHPRETLALLRATGIRAVAGNHDLMAVGRLPLDGGVRARHAIQRTRAILSDDEVDYLAALPDVLRPAPRVVCVHAVLGSPLRRLREFWEFAAEAARLRVLEPGIRICCFGHTHQQRAVAVLDAGGILELTDETVQLPDGALTFINPGTVGYPRDGDTRAAYAILDPERHTVSFHKVRYDAATPAAPARHPGVGARARSWLAGMRRLAAGAALLMGGTR